MRVETFFFSVAGVVFQIQAEGFPVNLASQFLTLQASKAQYCLYLRRGQGKNELIMRNQRELAYVYGKPKFYLRQLMFAVKYMVQSLVFAHDILLLHGSAFKFNNQGFGALGLSGAGKSTFLGHFPLSERLGDDTVVLRKDKGGYCLYTSPFDQQKQPNLIQQNVPLQQFLLLKKAVFQQWQVITNPSENLNWLLGNSWYYLYYYPEKIYASKQRVFRVLPRLTPKHSVEVERLSAANSLELVRIIADLVNCCQVAHYFVPKTITPKQMVFNHETGQSLNH